MIIFPINRAHLLFLILAWVTVFPPEALAYLDPGTGSLIIQSVTAAVVAAGFAIRLYWGRIVGVFKRTSDGGDASSSNPSEGPSGTDS